MDTQKRTFELNSFLFESNAQEVSLEGTIVNGNMSFPTEICISHSQLNILINQLKKQNEVLNIEDFLESEEMYNGEVLYTAVLSNKISRIIDLSILTLTHSIMQVRA